MPPPTRGRAPARLAAARRPPAGCRIQAGQQGLLGQLRLLAGAVEIAERLLDTGCLDGHRGAAASGCRRGSQQRAALPHRPTAPPTRTAPGPARSGRRSSRPPYIDDCRCHRQDIDRCQCIRQNGSRERAATLDSCRLLYAGDPRAARRTPRRGAGPGAQGDRRPGAPAAAVVGSCSRWRRGVRVRSDRSGGTVPTDGVSPPQGLVDAGCSPATSAVCGPITRSCPGRSTSSPTCCEPSGTGPTSVRDSGGRRPAVRRRSGSRDTRPVGPGSWRTA